MAEWFKAHAWKACKLARVSQVRILSFPPKPKHMEKKVSENNTIIELKGLTKRYGYGDTESFALKDFDLTIKRGEFIMIMGPSGCGKTFMVKQIASILNMDFIDIGYINEEYLNMDIVELREKENMELLKNGGK